MKLLPVTHVLVDTWMLTVQPVYKHLNMFYDLKWTTNTHVTPFSLTFRAELTISMTYFFTRLSTHISTRPYSFLPVQMMSGRVST